MAENPKIDSAFFHKDDLNLHYCKWGNGPYIMVALHGFGRSYKDFPRFTKPLSERFTVFAVDIFFHGESSTSRKSPDKQPLSPAAFCAFFSAFFDHIGADKVWLMGYSLGGRLAMVLAQNMAARVGGLYLFAPDGLIVNRWYGLLSHYTAGRAFFRFLKQRPQWAFGTVHLLVNTGVISLRTSDFVRSQIETPEAQQRVYMVWCFLRKLDPDFRLLSKQLSIYKVTLDLYFGIYDNIIPEKNAKKLRKYYPATKVYYLRSGHFLLKSAHMLLILKEGKIQLPEAPPL
jgi:pimeloyl-ACP methyl ester carboxylesterase